MKLYMGKLETAGLSEPFEVMGDVKVQVEVDGEYRDVGEYPQPTFEQVQRMTKPVKLTTDVKVDNEEFKKLLQAVEFQDWKKRWTRTLKATTGGRR